MFEPDTKECQYSSRRAVIVDQLSSLYDRDDVVKVAEKRLHCSSRIADVHCLIELT